MRLVRCQSVAFLAHRVILSKIDNTLEKLCGHAQLAQLRFHVMRKWSLASI
jgi:hypothetical protein